jgi:hypothetical protein
MTKAPPEISGKAFLMDERSGVKRGLEALPSRGSYNRYDREGRLSGRIPGRKPSNLRKQIVR